MIGDLQRIFLEVADLGSEARSSYYEKHGVVTDLRLEIESLLRFDAGSGDSLNDVVGTTVEQAFYPLPEQSCGPYELVGVLGEGGMGSVHLGRRIDGEVNLNVAIKLIRGAGAGFLFRDQFLQERQILASLQHPGIARLLDAGHTKSGQPYLVMEYVDGIPIDVYCVELSLKEKLKLFLLVCDAVAYLHRNLVIHRDLKPSNILVEPGGTPKILDFGIARIVDDSAHNSITRDRRLTPDYASPEQVKGNARNTSTDLYSLGAVLYVLLTGQSPHVNTTGNETIEEVICTIDPVSPERLNPALPRDLGLVVRKALRKEPSERYSTVEAFAEDLRAILESRPISVGSDDIVYRMRKFARRHWLSVSAVAAVIFSLTAGLYLSNREKAVAQRRFVQLRQLSNRVLAFDGEIRELPGSTRARERLVSVSIEYLDGLRRESHNDIDLTLEVANGYMTTAQVQGVPISASLGHFEEADASLQKAGALVESVLAIAPARIDALLLAAEIEQDRMVIADTVHNWPDALLHSNRSALYADRLTKIPSLTNDQKTKVARYFTNIGQSEMNEHRYEDAAVHIRRAIELARNAEAPSRLIAQSLSALANARRQAGDVEGALASITEARSLGEKAEFPNEVARANVLYAILWRQGVILGEDESISLNRPADAIEPLEKAFELVDGLASKDPNDASSRDRMGTAGQQLGDVLRHIDPARALEVYDRTIARLREINNSVNARRREARLLAHSSYPLRSLHRSVESKQRIDASFALLRPLGEDPSMVGILGGEWDNASRALADYESEAGHPERALATLIDLQSRLMALHPSPEKDLRHAADISRLYQSIAETYAKLGKYDEARTYQNRRMDLWQLWNRKLSGNSFVRAQIDKPLLNLPQTSAK